MPFPEPIPLNTLIWAYTQGMFPMAEERDGQVQWYKANPRAVLPLDQLKVSHSLRQRIRRGTYEIRVDTAFEEVIRSCAQTHDDRPRTWINDQIIDAFVEAHHAGLTHSVEAWGLPPDVAAGLPSADSAAPLPPGERVLLGGLYGMALGGAFFGESMFSRATDASKVCLVYLVEHLRARGFALLDVQMNSEHMAQFGTIDIPREEYEKQLEHALAVDVRW